MSKNLCPFGSQFQKYWDKRYQLFSKWDEGIQIDAESLYSVTPELIAHGQAKRLKDLGCESVIDGFCGVGGNVIAFASYIPQVYTIELNHQRLLMAQHNAEIYDVRRNITFIEGDFLSEVTKISADAVYLDPPWGGPDYKRLGRFKLVNFIPEGTILLNYALNHFRVTALKVPLIFDIKELGVFNTSYDVRDEIVDGYLSFRTVYFVKS